MWKLKATENSLNLGDRNTGFFHTTTKQNYRRLRIDALKDKNDNWCTDRIAISDVLFSHFSDMSTSEDKDIPPHILDLIPSCISREENDALIAPPSEDEIKFVLFGMHPNKSPGPDGFPAIFFQKNWNLIKSDLVATISSSPGLIRRNARN